MASAKPVSFGALLKRYRRAAGLTQEALAARSGYSANYLSMLERGQRLAPRSTIDLLAEALDLAANDRDYLLAAARQHEHAGLSVPPAANSVTAGGVAAPIQSFLIADVRGYTRFTVEHGDEAAADLAARFAALVRTVAEGHGGRLLELRGDEALVAFASVRQALHAAVALQARIAGSEQEQPALPVQVGIGLDVGEAVPVDDGYRGSALNLAARLCGLAGPGVILASDGAVHLAGKVSGLVYVDRGSVQVKGFANPLRIVQVLEEGAQVVERQVAASGPRSAGAAISESATVIVADYALEGSGRTSSDGLTGSALDGGLRADWGEAPSAEDFCGRQQELSELNRWVAEEHCRVIVVSGAGGVGKTTLVARLCKQLSERFEAVYWRSLQNAPTMETVLRDCLSFLTARRQVDMPKDIHEQLALLVETLRKHPSLLILDNVESILQVGYRTGQYREGYEGYGRLLRRLGDVDHRSCLLLTTREKPKEIVQLEGASSAVRSLHLRGMGLRESQQLLQGEGLVGSAQAWGSLVTYYAGNPLALKLGVVTIQDLFGGDIAEFLREEPGVFGDVQELLEQQFERLSDLEQAILYWLAIDREAAGVRELEEALYPKTARGELLAALESLSRRSMLERSGAGLFTLQPVVMEYLVDELLRNTFQEIVTGKVRLLASHTLMTAQAKEYVRTSQSRLIVQPLAERLLTELGRSGFASKARQLLSGLRSGDSVRSGYLAGNLLTLLIALRIDLRDFDFSHVDIRQVYLQGESLADVNFSGSTFAHCIFSEAFGNVLAVAFNPDGDLLAASTTDGTIQLWHSPSGMPALSMLCHDDWIWSIAFSPDGGVLASGSEDQTARLWNVTTGRGLHELEGHGGPVFSVAFSPDGTLLATGSGDHTIRLWSAATGELVRILEGHPNVVRTVAFNPDGTLLASGSEDGSIRLWNVATGATIGVLQGHDKLVRTVVFSPDGTLLASGAEDKTTRLWDVATGATRVVFQGHNRTIAFGPDGRTLATGGADRVIRIWEVGSGQLLKTLQGHDAWVMSIAFTSKGGLLASGSEDQTVRLWDVAAAHCLKTLQGHTNPTLAVAFASGEGHLLASGNGDRDVRLWDTETGRCLRILRGHNRAVRTVAFSPDGALLVSGGPDGTVRLWNARTGECLKTLSEHTSVVWSVAFSPDGTRVASGSADRTVCVWDVSSGRILKALHGSNSWVWSVAFSADGEVLAGGCGDHSVQLWDVETGTYRGRLEGHQGPVYSVAFSPDGTLLASGSGDRTIRIWDVAAHACVRVLHGHTSVVADLAISPDNQRLCSGSYDRTARLWDVQSGRALATLGGTDGWIYSVAFSPDDALLASGSTEGTIRLWDAKTGRALRMLKSDRLYERMDITGVTGLTPAQKATLKMLGAIEREPTSAQ